MNKVYRTIKDASEIKTTWDFMLETAVAHKDDPLIKEAFEELEMRTKLAYAEEIDRRMELAIWEEQKAFAIQLAQVKMQEEILHGSPGFDGLSPTGKPPSQLYGQSPMQGAIQTIKGMQRILKETKKK